MTRTALDASAAGAPVAPAAGATLPVPVPPRPLRALRSVRNQWQLWLMVLPALVFTAVFAYVPLYGLQLAFRTYVPARGLSGGEWVGLDYFVQFFESPLFSTIVLNTVQISLWTLAMGFVAPIVLALLINQISAGRLKSFVQTITYMPHFISVVVIVAMINIFLRPENGLLGRFLPGQNLLAEPDAFSTIYWVSEVWQHCGWNAIIYLAALSTVDTSLYEAAKIDGAGRLRLIRYVDIPTILPTAAILLILNMGSVLSVGFEKVYLMQNSLNLSSAEVIATYTYKIGILSNQFSYSTAIGLFNTVINFSLLIVANQLAKRATGSSVF
ncbi:putative aldouronate transport system permease protein [Rathayibacter sp. PhB151]|uniref:ABC transporter permease n=1 Tax=Rathayibacter sp. PhB151 TaxID=2485189 RepID=UPI001062D730|nr:ABC transporter permease subunit [Rathayibacter sp. PhB151]TDX78893.1 putative aldouronate transport system permease protein [Rathayibacter sp. PhB151]